jgi:acyl-coenzyme A thioesterase PaaI-like protein
VIDAYASARQSAHAHGDFAPLIALVPYARYLNVGMQIHQGEPRSHLPYAESLVGNTVLPALHGGVTAAFMENAAILHLLLQLDETRIPKSIDFSIDYLKPGRAEDSYADCVVSRAGLRVAQVMIRCWQKSPEQPIAVARAHFLLGATE